MIGHRRRRRAMPLVRKKVKMRIAVHNEPATNAFGAHTVRDRACLRTTPPRRADAHAAAGAAARALPRVAPPPCARPSSAPWKDTCTSAFSRRGV
eukprot:3422960-Prymnesium_polylepis.1